MTRALDRTLTIGIFKGGCVISVTLAVPFDRFSARMSRAFTSHSWYVQSCFHW
jgi:hypothetical protein